MYLVVLCVIMRKQLKENLLAAFLTKNKNKNPKKKKQFRQGKLCAFL